MRILGDYKKPILDVLAALKVVIFFDETTFVRLQQLMVKRMPHVQSYLPTVVFVGGWTEAHLKSKFCSYYFPMEGVVRSFGQHFTKKIPHNMPSPITPSLDNAEFLGGNDDCTVLG
nr:unnamed protein product [Spirometra erinaceieuropaei]